MARKCPALLALLAAAGLGAGALASEWASAEYGFKVTCPDGGNWKPVKIGLLHEPAFALAEGAGEGEVTVHRGFIVEVYPRAPEHYDWNGAGIGIVHSALLHQHRARNVTGSLFTFNGLPAYECSAEIVGPEDKGLVRITGILTDRYWYYVSIVKFPGDPAADPELQAMRLSFQFTGKPSPPTPPPPRLPDWIPGVTVIAVAVVLAAGGLLLVQRLRRNRTRPRRMRYTYSEKAQELAGNPVGGAPASGGAAPRSTLSAGFGLDQQERDLVSTLRAPNLLMVRGLVGPLMSMGAPPNPKDFGKHLSTSPLKLDRRFLKQKPKPEAPGAGPAGAEAPPAPPRAGADATVLRAEATSYVPGSGPVLSGVIVSGAVRPGMSFAVPGFPVRLTVHSVELVGGGAQKNLVGLLLQDVGGELTELWKSLDVAGRQVTLEGDEAGG